MSDRCRSEAEVLVGSQRHVIRCAKHAPDGRHGGLHVGFYPEGSKTAQWAFWRPNGSRPSQAEIAAEAGGTRGLERVKQLPAKPAPPQDPAQAAKDEAMRVAKAKGYMVGHACTECGSMDVVQNGTCGKCLNCGASTGCS